MVRVASLLDMVNAEYKGKDIAGMNAREQLDAIHDRVHEFVNVQYSTWQRSLLPGQMCIRDRDHGASAGDFL